MKRDHFLYRLRRHVQVLVCKLTSPEFVSKIYFRIILGYKLNLKNPRTFNEKLQWLKLRYWPKCEEAIKCTDKYAVREYMRSIGEERLLNDLLFVWDDPEEIEWEKLPNAFVIKCNHGCGYNILCPDKSKLDINAAKKKLKRWMKEDFSLFNAEPHYSKIKKKIICEKFLEGEVINYNIYCCNGVPVFLYVADGLGDGVDEHLTYYNMDGTRASFTNRFYRTRDNVLPENFFEMVATAKRIAKDFPMVRVDLFNVAGRIVFSELTFTPGGALNPFSPPEVDLELGDKLDLTNLIDRAESNV